MNVLISGGFGDSINQLAKLIYYCEQNDISHNTVNLVYCRDIYDNQIIANSHTLSTSKDYIKWVNAVALANGFTLTSIEADQKEEANTNRYDIVLGPNMNYEIKVWEESRGLHIGHRPKELQIVPDAIIKWEHELIEDIDIAIQIRFDDEYPTKVGSSFQTEIELLRLLKNLNYRDNKIVLFGESQKDLSKFDKIVQSYVNESTKVQYDVLLSAKKCVIVNEGFGSNLALSAGKKTYRKERDKLEYELQTSSCMKKYVTLFQNYVELKINE